jgi:HD superfamily phosphohydrolase YqeK
VTDRVNRPHFKPGRKRLYVRDSLSKTKRGKNAIKKVEKIRIKALRVKTVNAQTLNEIEKKNADRVLTEKQRMFVRYWAQGETPRTACLMAGFSESSVGLGWKLAHDPAILKIYREEKKLYEEAQGHTKARVMSMLQEAYDCAKLISEPATMVAAARELGKMAGHYEPEKHLHIHAGSKLLDRMNSLSDEELLKIMDQEDALPGVFERIAETPLVEDKSGRTGT